METRVRSVFRVSRLSGYTSVFKETVAASFSPPCLLVREQKLWVVSFSLRWRERHAAAWLALATSPNALASCQHLNHPPSLSVFPLLP